MYSGLRNIKSWEKYEQRELVDEQRRELGAEIGPGRGPGVGLQKAYRKKGWLGCGR